MNGVRRMADAETLRQIGAYLPNSRDGTLAHGEYFYLKDTSDGGRVIRVEVRGVMSCEDGVEYDIYQRVGRRALRVDPYNDPHRGVRKADLYDNRCDCRRQTHPAVDWWEQLRQAQREERLK